VSLSDELMHEQQRPQTVCGTCKWYAGLNPADRADFDAWVAAGKTVTALWRACKRLPDNPYLLARCSFAKHLAEHHDAR
jgi:hypothetical protein